MYWENSLYQMQFLTSPVDTIDCERPEYLTEQLITYIGNKRALLDFIGGAIDIVKEKTGKDRLDIFDVFSGSGVVSRFFKKYADKLIVNDIEKYVDIINQCYLSNEEDIEIDIIKVIFHDISDKLVSSPLQRGFFAELYAPASMDVIKQGERVFYTPRNAMFLDTARQYINDVPAEYQKFLLAPLLSEASIHANTSGVFKGFYKNSKTGFGQFGGNNKDALTRILCNIELKFPVFSKYSCKLEIYQGDANTVVDKVDEVDIAYMDPPYNQHPYGSNYFMLNLLVDYIKPDTISKVSGIPDNWNRSAYNKPQLAYDCLNELCNKVKAKYLLISFSSEGFIKLEQMTEMLEKIGKVDVMEMKYNTFRASRNLLFRDTYVKEYLYLVEKY